MVYIFPPAALQGWVFSQTFGRRWPQRFPHTQQCISRSCILPLPDSFTEESVFIAKYNFALVMYGFQKNSWNLMFTSRVRGYRNTFNLHMSNIPGVFCPCIMLNLCDNCFFISVDNSSGTEINLFSCVGGSQYSEAAQ